MDVIAYLFDRDTQAAERLGDYSQLVISGIFYGNVRCGHGCHTDKAADFDHIRQNGMGSSSQGLDPFDGEQIRTYPRYAGTHLVEHGR